MAGAELVLDGVPRSIPRARRWLRDLLGPRPAYDADVACLLVSELTTHALLHARSVLVVRAVDDGGELRLEVSDGSSDPALGGIDEQGLTIVRLLAADCGVERRADGRPGRTVWCTLRSGGAGAEGGRAHASA